MINEVLISARALKQLEKLPRHIQVKFFTWQMAVGESGLETVRKIPGFHDEPLRGKRDGQRSIRLNRSYRVIYEIHKNGLAEIVSVEEINIHEY